MQRASSARLALAAIILVMATQTASAQAIRCTSFLHGRDGSWRSMDDGFVFGPSGRLHIGMGEILRPTDRTAKGEVARALNELCEGR